jgi:hypothetical protein
MAAYACHARCTLIIIHPLSIMTADERRKLVRCEMRLRHGTLTIIRFVNSHGLASH